MTQISLIFTAAEFYFDIHLLSSEYTGRKYLYIAIADYRRAIEAFGSVRVSRRKRPEKIQGWAKACTRAESRNGGDTTVGSSSRFGFGPARQLALTPAPNAPLASLPPVPADDVITRKLVGRWGTSDYWTEFSRLGMFYMEVTEKVAGGCCGHRLRRWILERIRRLCGI